MLAYLDSDHDEKKFAEIVISKSGATPNFIELTHDSISMENIRDAVVDFEAIQNAEPSIGPWLIYQEMRKINSRSRGNDLRRRLAFRPGRRGSVSFPTRPP